MFWKREKKVIHTSLGHIGYPEVPPKKEFKTMFELLSDAEKFDNKNEIELSNKVLKILTDYIENYKSNNLPSK